MENTSKLPQVSDRDLFYYRQRSKNRLFEALTAFFAEEAERRGITKRDVAESLRRDPSQITRWLSAPSNMTVESISDLLLSLGAEIDHVVARFSERASVNEMHPLIQQIIAPPPKIEAKDKGPKPRYQPISTANTNIVSNTTVSRAPITLVS